MRRKEKKSEIWEFSEENGISMAFSLQLKGFESYDWEVHFIEKKKERLDCFYVCERKELIVIKNRQSDLRLEWKNCSVVKNVLVFSPVWVGI